jgi:hypothetical protein
MIAVAKRKLKIGPKDHGRRMSLKDYEFVHTEEGYLYELSRGFITVSRIAKLYHALIVAALRDHLAAYKFAHPGAIFAVLGAAECKLLIKKWESERHPDLSVYLTSRRAARTTTNFGVIGYQS